jgi:hypothetical protein
MPVPVHREFTEVDVEQMRHDIPDPPSARHRGPLPILGSQALKKSDELGMERREQVRGVEGFERFHRDVSWEVSILTWLRSLS